jgi:hypothetical protein
LANSTEPPDAASTPADLTTPYDAAEPPADLAHASPCASLVICDDFEGYTGTIANGATLGKWKASVGGTGTTMMVDSVKVYSGTKSLHVTTPAGGYAYGTLRQSNAAGLVPGNNVFGRVMIYYSNAGGNGLPNNVHSWVFNASGKSTADNGTMSMDVAQNGSKTYLNYHPVAGGEQNAVGGTVSAGAWHCLQWQFDGSGSPPKDEARIWIDGTKVLDVAATQGWHFATPWDTFDFGFNHYQTLAAGVDVYLDDFALDSAMIACP